MADVERAEKRLNTFENQRAELDQRYNELMEKYRQVQNQLMGCECSGAGGIMSESERTGSALSGRRLDMPLQLEHLNKPAYSAF